MKKEILALSLITLLIASCSAPQKEPDKLETLPEVVEEVKEPRTAVFADMPNYQFEFSSLKLNQHMKDLDLRVFKHFGEFYTDEFTIYRLNRIDYLAESYFIDDINLYFIDSLLVKIQAYLREDKSHEFLNRYGAAKIYINDYHNKKLLETEKVLVKDNGKYRINENLDYYTLRWKREETDIEYVVNKKADSTMTIAADDIRYFDDKRHRFKLTFQTYDYENQLAWVKWESYKEARGLVAQPASEEQ
ncbi:MAG: hypothetical protein HWE21_14930 [Cytophagia bacterium]|nr:hypothetical protein [Cytophagia bacterium]